jgi:mRNA deadenylase 3'-5' endonuclease subunit Ccr4
MIIAELSEFLPLDKPSILCFNEVDQYDEFYKRELEFLGYDANIAYKEDKVGCLIGWDNQIFTL